MKRPPLQVTVHARPRLDVNALAASVEERGVEATLFKALGDMALLAADALTHAHAAKVKNRKR